MQVMSGLTRATDGLHQVFWVLHRVKPGNHADNGRVLVDAKGPAEFGACADARPELAVVEAIGNNHGPVCGKADRLPLADGPPGIEDDRGRRSGKPFADGENGTG